MISWPAYGLIVTVGFCVLLVINRSWVTSLKADRDRWKRMARGISERSIHNRHIAEWLAGQCVEGNKFLRESNIIEDDEVWAKDQWLQAAADAVEEGDG